MDFISLDYVKIAVSVVIAFISGFAFAFLLTSILGSILLLLLSMGVVSMTIYKFLFWKNIALLNGFIQNITMYASENWIGVLGFGIGVVVCLAVRSN